MRKTNPKPEPVIVTLPWRNNSLKQGGLVGAWFHSVLKTGAVSWQGQIMARPEPGLYLVQLYEWALGEPSIQRLVKLEDMQDWLFYKDNEAMLFSWKYGTAKPGTPYNPSSPSMIF